MIQHYFIYGEERIPYRVFTKPTLHDKIAIHVQPDGSVQVDTPPHKTHRAIQAAVYKRAGWIFRKLKDANAYNAYALPRRYVSGESHFYLGRRYQLKVLQDRKCPGYVKLQQGKFRVVTPKKNGDSVKALLWDWYHQHAMTVFSRRMNAILQSASRSRFRGMTPKLRLLEMKRQWGSCSPGGVIILNPHLVKAPIACIDYVITHELCHLLEHNHSPRFYRLLSKTIPDWEAIKTRLDGMAALILVD